MLVCQDHLLTSLLLGALRLLQALCPHPNNIPCRAAAFQTVVKLVSMLDW